MSSYDDLSRKARKVSKATRDDTVRSLADIVDELCRKMKEMDEYQEIRKSIRGRSPELKESDIDGILDTAREREEGRDTD